MLFVLFIVHYSAQMFKFCIFLLEIVSTVFNIFPLYNVTFFSIICRMSIASENPHDAVYYCHAVRVPQ